jgi:hypothetical protein
MSYIDVSVRIVSWHDWQQETPDEFLGIKPNSHNKGQSPTLSLSDTLALFFHLLLYLSPDVIASPIAIHRLAQKEERLTAFRSSL